MSSLRRLAKDHASLRASLPPNYLFPHSSDPINNSISDELTNLAIYLTGPTSTPYTAGLFLLRLRIPATFPVNPPTATFQTKIFHPNVDEKTGAVCLETLKRDWDPKLTLKDILIHISCLLLQPNPDSALNENAGVLVREDYDGFERKARLMTRIHAGIPNDYRQSAEEARTRGEQDDSSDVRVAKFKSRENHQFETRIKASSGKTASTSLMKENDHSQGVVDLTGDKSNKSVLGKRIASVTLLSSDEGLAETNGNNSSIPRNRVTGEPLRKSPKHSHEPSRDLDHVDERVDRIEAFVDASQMPHETTSATEAPILLPLPSNKLLSGRKGALRPYARIGIRRL